MILVNWLIWTRLSKSWTAILLDNQRSQSEEVQKRAAGRCGRRRRKLVKDGHLRHYLHPHIRTNCQGYFALAAQVVAKPSAPPLQPSRCYQTDDFGSPSEFGWRCLCYDCGMEVQPQMVGSGVAVDLAWYTIWNSKRCFAWWTTKTILIICVAEFWSSGSSRLSGLNWVAKPRLHWKIQPSAMVRLLLAAEP